MCEQNNDINSDLVLKRRLNEVPIRALSVSTRHQLSLYLNGEQVITTSNGLSRDYRGLCELMGFQYSVLNNILRNNDPFDCLIQMYGNRSDATFEQLIQMIEQIGRFDVIDDLFNTILNDAKHYIKNQKSNQTIEKTMNTNTEENDEQIIIYDGYVCYADNDLDFVKVLSQYLEEKNGLRLFIRDRDMLLGSWVYQSFAQLIHSQCRRVLIILSPQFLDCPECQFQSQFATGLAIEQRNRKLIPIIYRKCVIPPIIRMLTKIDMTLGKDSPEWSWNRLKNSLMNTSIVCRQKSECLALTELPSNASNNSEMESISAMNESLITLPSDCPQPTAPPMVSFQSNNSSIIISEVKDNLENTSLLKESNSDSKKANPRKWIQSIKQKFKVSSS